MSHPPLKLLNCFFSDLQIKENQQFSAPDDYWVTPTPEDDIDFRVRVFHDSNENNGRWRAGLLIETGDLNDDSDIVLPYTIHVMAIGEFLVVDESKGLEELEDLVAKVGGAMLYSSAREFLAVATSRMLHGTYFIPTVSFLKMKRTEPEKLEDSKE